MLTAQAQAQGTLTGTRASGFTYLPSGLLESETIEPDAGKADYCVKTVYTYDDWGNKNLSTTSNCPGASSTAAFVSRSAGTTYGTQTVTVAGISVTSPAGQFATSAQNALGHSEQREYDPRFGVLTKLTGPNGLSTVFAYDDFGRKIKETRADGTSTSLYHCILVSSGVNTSSNSSTNGVCASASLSGINGEVPSTAFSFVQTEMRDSQGNLMGAVARIYADRQGRTVRELSQTFDGTTQPTDRRYVVKDTLYNAQGVAYFSTAPYFLGSGASTVVGSNSRGLSWTRVDALGRPTQIDVSDPEGNATDVQPLPSGYTTAPAKVARTAISYSGLTTTTANPKGQTRKEEKNADGQLVRVADAYGAQIAYQHDAFGNLVQTRDALQNIVKISYDLRGRKSGMIDPDTGTWAYAYNALGELTWQRSPNQAALPTPTATTMAYDRLGRMTSRVDPEYTSTWFYDTYASGSACNKGTGKLCESTTNHGVNKKIVYDNLGRPINGRTTVTSGPSFATALQYELITGRLLKQTYPTGVQVQYAYTALGFLSQVQLATSATVSPLPATPGGTPGAGKTLSAGAMLWSASTVNAWGRAETQSLNSGVNTRTSFEPNTGRMLSTSAGAGSATNVLNQAFQWDALGNLRGRSDNNGTGDGSAITEAFSYDSINRLTQYAVSGPQVSNVTRTVDLSYNAIGNLLSKSDVGNYTYPAYGSSGGSSKPRPHAVSTVASTGLGVGGFGTSTYSYDANGNLTSASGGKYRSVSYTSFNLPDSQSILPGGTTSGGMAGSGGSPRYGWKYDENHQRLSETRTDASGTRTTWFQHPDNLGGLGFESEQAAAGGVASNRHYVSAGSQTLVLVTRGALPTLQAGDTQPPALSNPTFVKLEYWHKDHLGSTAATSDHLGVVTARYAYDPFGKRRNTNGNYDAAGTIVSDWRNDVNYGTDRGFTGHEHLDDLGVIHMNGRIFDPTIARFMQGDPMVQDPTNLQNYNRYTYCYSNPLTCTDPSGFWSWKNPIRNAKYFDPVGNYITTKVAHNQIGYSLGRVAIGIVSLYCNGWYAACVAGGTAAWETFAGHSDGQAFRAGLISGVTAYATQAVGDLTTTTTTTEYAGIGFESETTVNVAGNIAGHAAVGCGASLAGGGKCRSGALAGAFGAAYANSGANGANVNIVYGTLQNAAAGGIGSVLGGGKFSDGAVTGSFGYLFNYLQHCGSECMKREGYEPTYYKEDGILCNGKANLGGCGFPGAIGGGEPMTVQLGVSGQVGAWMLGGAGEVGIAVPTTLNDVCIYAQMCAVAGPQFVLSASGAVSLGQGAPSTGVQGSKGFTWFGGNGAFGSVQMTVNPDGQVQGTRGVVRGGVGTGAGAGYVECGQATACLRR